MKIHNLLTVFSVSLAGCIAYTTSAQAENWSDRINITGFGSSIYQATNDDASFNGDAEEEGIGKDGSFQETKLGLNINAQITDRLTVASQIFGEASGAYAAQIDWVFAAIKLADDTTLKVGKIKYPVGLVNEYRDVGYAYPWLTTPYVIYTETGTEDASGTTRTAPSVTREAYTGFSLAWNKVISDWTLDVNLFGGSVALESSDVKKLIGVTVNLDWDDTTQLTVSSYKGTMRNVPDFRANATTGLPEANPMTAMNGKEHSVDLIGVKTDWNNIIVYAEAAKVEMENLKPMTSDEWYVTAGYRFGKWLPHYTYQVYENAVPAADTKHTEYNIGSIGLRYELMRNTALKFDIAKINQKDGNGLFTGTITNSDLKVTKYGIGIDYVF